MVGGSNHSVGRCLWLIIVIKRGNNLANLLVRQELPDAVRRDYHKLIVLLDVVLTDVRQRTDTHSVCDLISKRPGHGKAWKLLLWQPHSKRADVLTSLVISESFNPAASRLNPLSLCLMLGFLIHRKGVSCDQTILGQ